jgi:pre-rRNA-processing protein TSR4
MSKLYEEKVQLGFSVTYEDDEHKGVVSHKSPLWNEWDGGQIGGRPSWLNPKDLPNRFLKCEHCEDPLTFICQLYAPADEVNEQAFHRSMYIFACSTPSCAKERTGAVRVLRAQLPQENPFYPQSAGNFETWHKHQSESWDVVLCQVCGQKGKGKCPIQGVYFCGKQHQIEHKKYVFDKKNKNEKHDFLPSVYAESELVVEEEPVSGDNLDKEALFADDEDDDEDADLEQEDLNKITGAITSEVSKDQTTIEFYARTRGLLNVQEQCLRYLRWPTDQSAKDTNMPLWISAGNQPTDIPCCNYCGAERRFEFQLMPQMIHYLMQDHAKHKAQATEDGNTAEDQVKEAIAKATSIMDQAPPEKVPPAFAEAKEQAVEAMRAKIMREDGDKELNWGVIAVYTCTASCGGFQLEEDSELGGYREEFAWKQPSLD